MMEGTLMFEKDIVKFHREIGEIKNDLMNNDHQKVLDDHEKYTIATKIDLTVSRLIRLLEREKENES